MEEHGRACRETIDIMDDTFFVLWKTIVYATA